MHVKKENINLGQRGFTLIELVVGIVLFSVALVGITSVIMPQAKRGIDPIWQVRAVTLAQSLINEISSKAFDENAITASGRVACNHDIDCTQSGSLGADGSESRANFDDIDDFHGLVLNGVDISNSTGLSLTSSTSDLFLGFRAEISVFYDDNTDGVNDDDTNGDGNLDSGTLIGNQKIIQIIITTPDGEDIPFSAYRNNF